MTTIADKAKKLRSDFQDLVTTQNRLFTMAAEALQPGVPQARRTEMANLLRNITNRTNTQPKEK